MQTNIIAIGNSRGIRIPKAILEELDLKSPVKLTSTNRGLLISPKKPRAKWDETFKKANTGMSQEDKEFLDFPNQWDDEEWQW